MNLPRKDLELKVIRMMHRSRAVALVGARQSGKSTIAKEIAKKWEGKVTMFDLEDPSSEARLRDPKLGLQDLEGLVVIDEVQRRPDLMPLLRVLLDRVPLPAKFLLLGSASPLLMREAAESLAGRIEFLDMRGFGLREVGVENGRKLQLRGGLPLSFLAGTDEDSLYWREGYLRSVLERDIRMMGVELSPVTLRRFLEMIAHLHGQTWNASDIGRSLQLAHTTTRRYLDVLTGAMLLRQLPPWFENAGKRVVKSPKVYVRDSGILHALLGLQTWEELEGHPKLGASWEGYALEQVLDVCGHMQAYFWGTHGGAELDLLLMGRGKRIGLEMKYTSSPSTTKSMHIAINDLKIDHLYVIHPGAERYPLAEKITALGLDVVDQIFSS